jgi:hypothetical protein
VNHNEHAPPLLAFAAGAVAFISDDLGRLVALAVGSGGLAISLVRLRWEWEDRKAARARRLKD